MCALSELCFVCCGTWINAVDNNGWQHKGIMSKKPDATFVQPTPARYMTVIAKFTIYSNDVNKYDLPSNYWKYIYTYSTLLCHIEINDSLEIK